MNPLCATCGTPARGVSDLDGKPLCRDCRRKPYRKPTLANLAGSRGSPPKARQCRICLALETFTTDHMQQVSSIKGGVCRDREACEKRQPPLFEAAP